MQKVQTVTKQLSQFTNKDNLHTYIHRVSSPIITLSKKKQYWSHKLIAKYLDYGLKDSENGKSMYKVLNLFKDQFKQSRTHSQHEQMTFVYRFYLSQLLCFYSFICQHTSQRTRELNLFNNKLTPILYSQPYQDFVIFSIKLEEGHLDTEPQKSQQTMLQQKLDRQQQKTAQPSVNLGLVEQFINDMIGHEGDTTILYHGENDHSLDEPHTFYLMFHDSRTGKGGFGQVYKGRSIRHGPYGLLSQEVAIKRFKLTKDEHEDRHYLIRQQRQIPVLEGINRLLLQNQQKRPKTIVDLKSCMVIGKRCYVVYEYCAYGTLRNKIREAALTKKQVYDIAYSLIMTLELLHYGLIKNDGQYQKFISTNNDDEEMMKDLNRLRNQNPKVLEQKQKGIIHRDIKPDNIMIKSIDQVHTTIRLIDFGFAKQVPTELKLSRICCGTRAYQAPEVSAKSHYDCKVDVWSLGAVLFELFTGTRVVLPGDRDDITKSDESIERTIDDTGLDTYYPMSQEEIGHWKHIFRNCLKNDPKQRWSSKRLLKEAYNRIYVEKLINLKTVEALEQIKALKADLFMHLSKVKNIFKSQSMKAKLKIEKLVSLQLKQRIVKASRNILIDRYPQTQDQVNLIKQCTHFQQPEVQEIKLAQMKSAVQVLVKSLTDYQQKVQFQEVARKIMTLQS